MTVTYGVCLGVGEAPYRLLWTGRRYDGICNKCTGTYQVLNNGSLKTHSPSTIICETRDLPEEEEELGLLGKALREALRELDES